MHVYKESPLEGESMAQSGHEWLNRVDGCLGASTQYASGRRALTPEAEQRKETRTIADARRELIECQNELGDLRLSPDLKSTKPKNKTTKKCKVLYQKTNSALSFLRGQTETAPVKMVTAMATATVTATICLYIVSRSGCIVSRHLGSGFIVSRSV